MATIPFEEVFASRPFKFFVGPDKKLYYAHPAAIKKLSQPLSVLVDGPMSEAQSGSGILEDTEEHTFVQFCQFAYTGDYDAAEPEIILDSSAIDATDVANGAGEAESADSTPPTPPVEPKPEPEPVEPLEELEEEYHSAWGRWKRPSAYTCQNCGCKSIPHSKKGKKRKQKEPAASLTPKMEGPAPAGRSKTSNLWADFNFTRYGHSKTSFEARKNVEVYEEYTKVFFCHAQLYVFADKYDIPSLRELSLYKLHRTLIAFSLYPERVGDIVELIRYTYANTADGPQGEDLLKQMVIRYATCVIEDLAVDGEFQRLLEGPGSLSQDIVLQMLKRLPA